MVERELLENLQAKERQLEVAIDKVNITSQSLGSEGGGKTSISS